MVVEELLVKQSASTTNGNGKEPKRPKRVYILLIAIKALEYLKDAIDWFLGE